MAVSLIEKITLFVTELIPSIFIVISVVQLILIADGSEEQEEDNGSPTVDRMSKASIDTSDSEES